MDKNFSSYNLSEKLKIQRYLKICGTLSEVETIVRELNSRNPPLGHLSVLGKVADFSEQDFGCTIASLTRLTSTAIHLLHAADLGKIFVSGALSSLLLEKIDGKALGSLEGGLVGILNGYGVNHKKTSHYLKHLKEGKLLVIAWDYAQHISKEHNAYVAMKLQKS